MGGLPSTTNSCHQTPSFVLFWWLGTRHGSNNLGDGEILSELYELLCVTVCVFMHLSLDYIIQTIPINRTHHIH